MTARAWRWDWIGPGLVALVALALRLWRLGYPNLLVFDETYYAKDAYSLTQHGYAQDFVQGANQRVEAGHLDHLMTGQPSQIVHPDGGKWLIALGEHLFGMNSFGWRVSAAVVGALTVLVLARLVLRLTGSVWIGCLAGVLLCFDGLHFVMSRMALLDVFLAFWLVCAVACLVADRDWITSRLDRHRPLRPWQLAAGVCFGMAMGTKWSGLWMLAAFGLATVLWELSARRTLRPLTLVRIAVPAFFSIVGVALVVYLLTWTGWLLHADLYAQRFGRGYGTEKAWGDYVVSPTGGPFGGIIDAFRSLWHYHGMTYRFHTGDYLQSKTHPYQSSPWGWLVLERPVAFDAQNDLAAATCGARPDSSCMREITALGNPAVWWAGTLAVLVAIGAWIRTRDGRWAVPVLGVLTAWLPWFQYDGRPIFQFYAVVAVPFMIVALCLVVDVMRRHATTARARYAVWLVAGTFTALTISLFWYFYPILTDQLISYDAWYSRMWFGRHWI